MVRRPKKDEGETMPMNFKAFDHGIRGTDEEQRQARRQFLKTLAAAGGAVGLLSLFPEANLRAAGQTEVLLLSCMDFRLVDDTARYMKTRGLTGKYDHIILAGAALGALTEKFPAWNPDVLGSRQRGDRSPQDPKGDGARSPGLWGL
jgi:hypothetical protein